MKYKVVLKKDNKTIRPKFFNQDYRAWHAANKFVTKKDRHAKVYEINGTKKRLIYEIASNPDIDPSAPAPAEKGGPT